MEQVTNGMQTKRVVIVAGPNGAGKTTFATEFLPYEGGHPVFINADLIAAGRTQLESPSGEPLASRSSSFSWRFVLLEHQRCVEVVGRSKRLIGTRRPVATSRLRPRWRGTRPRRAGGNRLGGE